MNIISKNAKIGKNVKFGDFVTVYDNVEIGDDSIIDSYSEIGISNGKENGPLIIGSNAKIRSHSVLYGGSQIGNNLVTAHFSTIRENVSIGDGFQLGVYGLVQPLCKIGNYVKIVANVVISTGSEIGNYVWIFPYASFTSDPHPPSEGHITSPKIEDFAVIASCSILLPGVRVGKGAIVGAGCVLTKDLPDDQIAVGNPGKIIGPTSKLKIKGTDQPAYPWRRHFHRGYPKEIVEKWLNELESNKNE